MSHSAIENYLLLLFKQFSFPVIISRFANFYGPYQKLYRVIPLAIHKANKKEKFQISAPVFAKVCDESERDEYLAPARNNYTLYVGGMGAKDKNFYFNLMCEYGYEEIATQIQELYLKGEKAEAESIFPDELLDDLTLVGSKERIREKLEDWKNCNVTELSIAIPLDIETIKFIKSCL